MWQKIAAVGGAAAVILGAGTAALAATGSSSPAPNASPSAGASTGANPGQGAAHGKGHGKGKRNAALRHSLHGTWVSRDGKTNAFITHDEIRGQVTAVSATSITVKALDNFSQSYTVNADTKVHLRGDKKGATSSISGVHTGDQAIVVGTGTSTLTATHILAGLKK